ncbi:MAG: helix-turn-helix domain-containing protein [Oscillospiraceae bacterium]|nr:helix-turn-helix domain-containing protein [Oscillospiraceae bacterium]
MSKAIGEQIKKMRKLRKLTQKQLAEAAKVATGTIQQYELGKRKPSFENLIAISHALNVSVNMLCDLNSAPVIQLEDDEFFIITGVLADGFRSVYREISRQIELFGDQSDRHPLEYLAFITEEIGELAEAITETFMNGRHPERGGYDNMVKEAIHVAATAISAISCIRRMEMKQNELEI